MTGYKARCEARRRQAARRLATAELVAEIRQHALDHYGDGGWDVVVEAMSDPQIAEALHWYDPRTGKRHECRTLKSVLAHSTLADTVSVWADRQADAVNSAF